MRLRRIPQARSLVNEHALAITEQEAYKLPGCWPQVFGANKPLHVELGMGQGHFLEAMALAHPEHNYLGLERRAEPLLWLLKRLKQPYPENLRILLGEAAQLTNICAPQEIHTLYLFFPDPWPKSRHAKRRLTAPTFARQYLQVLEPAGRLIFKTDDAAFYDWSCNVFNEAGFLTPKAAENGPEILEEISTYYEERFRAFGRRIYYAQFMKPH
ncbi:MAG: tRNA (guanosine(46)-N7)-methyltransferase TrmB [Firmicutes bacterium]|nr:tRNA (guanosine(46)-N7)-methyltransferase TrmB [Bacillota bacterium]